MGQRHLNIALMRRRRAAQVAALSGARTLVRYEAEALALDFTDNYFYSTTSLYGSAYVKDTGTPANNYDSTPYGLLTYTSPSLKMTRGPDGLLRFGAHNLYLNSGSPANQSITVVSGATYSVDITGSVSVTASGAATGTWTAGSNTFTAATTTLTLGSTSGSGTASVRRTPSDSTYLATTSAARYALPYEWDASGNLQGILVEEARTNLAIHSDALDNAAHTKTNCTVSANNAVAGTGLTTLDKIVEASDVGQVHYVTLAATISGATTYTVSFEASSSGRDHACLQFSAAGSAYTAAERRIWFNLATGAVGTTGTRWTAHTPVPLGGGLYRYSATITTEGASTYGFLILTADADNSITYDGNGSSGINVGAVQIEAGSFPTSYIPTIASTVTRAADNISLATSKFPWDAATDSVYAKFRPLNVAAERRAIQLDDGTANERFTVGSDASANGFAQIVDGGATQLGPLTTGTVTTTAFEQMALAFAANDVALSSDGGAAATDTSATVPTVTTLRFGSGVSAASPLNGILAKALIVPRRVSNADLQTLTSTGVLPVPVPPSGPVNGIQLETGDYLLTEAGDYLVQEA